MKLLLSTLAYLMAALFIVLTYHVFGLIAAMLLVIALILFAYVLVITSYLHTQREIRKRWRI